MIAPLSVALAALLSLQNPAAPQEKKAEGPPASAGAAETPVRPQVDAPIEKELAQRLLKVRRIYVDSFGDDPVARQMQGFVITALASSKRFIVTENKDKADAILRGSGLEKTSQEFHAHREGTAVGGAAGGHSGSVAGSWSGGTGSVSGSSSGGFVAHSAAIDDANASTETINDARLALRLVDRDGDVIWTASQESKNAKYKSSSADVAERIVKQLLRDLDKLEKPETTPTTK
ncbi:MAG: hypothetical protein LAN37_12630 [Acidobacteriia bacterium]|nr:hypothetical protein [Terriglobia bacterium]